MAIVFACQAADCARDAEERIRSIVAGREAGAAAGPAVRLGCPGGLLPD